MIDIILALVIVGLLAYIAWKDYQDRIDRAKLVNALVAKHSQDLVNTTLADSSKIEVKPETPQVNDDLVPTDQLTNAQFEAMINEDNKEVDQMIS